MPASGRSDDEKIQYARRTATPRGRRRLVKSERLACSVALRQPPLFVHFPMALLKIPQLGSSMLDIGAMC